MRLRSIGRSRRRLVLAGSFVAATAAVIIVACNPWRFACHVPVRHGEGFHAAIARADRLVVRDGSFDCCGPDEGGTVLFEVADPATLKEIERQLRFIKDESKNSLEVACTCCGGPRLDWHRGGRRIALTGLQHGRSVRWKGFSTMRLFGVRVAYGDAPLTETSARWLAAFLSARSGQDFALSSRKPTTWMAFGAHRLLVRARDDDREPLLDHDIHRSWDGTASVTLAIAPRSWILVTASDDCTEAPLGTDSRGRVRGGDFARCGVGP